MESGDAYEVNFSRSRLAMVAVVAALATLLGVLLTGLLGTAGMQKEPGPLGIAIGAFCAFFFGGHAIRTLALLVSRRLAIRIDEHGLYEARHADRVIPCDQIEWIDKFEQRRKVGGFWSVQISRHVAYRVRPDFEMRPSLWQRWNTGLNGYFGITNTIDHVSAGVDYEEIAEAINKFAPDRLHISLWPDPVA